MLSLMIFLAVCALSGYLYYLGGEEGYDTKYRDIGCSALAVTFVIIFGQASWTWPLALCFIATFGLLWGALSAYWKFGDPDAKWYHWALHGLGCGLAWIPVAWCAGLWEALIAYTVCVSVAFAVWSEIFGNVKIEATGRGAFLIFFLPLLFWIR